MRKRSYEILRRIGRFIPSPERTDAKSKISGAYPGDSPDSATPQRQNDPATDTSASLTDTQTGASTGECEQHPDAEEKGG